MGRCVRPAPLWRWPTAYTEVGEWVVPRAVDAALAGGFFFGGNMTEFTQTLRHYCRNPRCRSKLPSPASDPRKAFCTRGCHSSFYLKRCVVCEGEMMRKAGNQLVCGKRRCRNALQNQNGLGRYPASSDAKLASKTLDFIDPKQANKPDRAWRIVAGPELSS